MPKKIETNEKQMIDLLQKQLIISLFKEGLTRDKIRKVLSISSDKVQSVIKYLKKSRGDKNERWIDKNERWIYWRNKKA